MRARIHSKELAATINKSIKDRKDPERYSNREFLDKIDQKAKKVQAKNDYEKFAAPHLTIEDNNGTEGTGNE